MIKGRESTQEYYLIINGCIITYENIMKKGQHNSGIYQAKYTPVRSVEYCEYFTGHWRASFQTLSVIPVTYIKKNPTKIITTKPQI